jgi:hypothetical protein
MFGASKTASVSGGYQISRSLRFNSADTTYLNRTPAGAGNRNTWTWSGWVKRSALSSASSQNIFGWNGGTSQEYFGIRFSTTDTLECFDFNFSFPFQLITSQVFRDPSAWYHIVLAVDTTQATASNRIKLYVNGVQVTAFGTATYPTQNYNTYTNTTNPATLGALWTSTAVTFLDGYMTEVNFVNAQQLTPSSFGETNAQTGVWQPKAFSGGAYGTNGFYLNFSDNSNTTAATLGKDYSGNGNNWTPNNFSVTAGAGNDSLVDSPTSYGTDTGVGGTVRGNYATLNPLDYAIRVTNTFSNGNLDVSIPYDIGYTNAQSTFAVSSGKWYCEVTPTNINGAMIGICDASLITNTQKNWSNAYWWGYFQNGSKYNNNASSAYGSSFTTNDVIGIALDMDTGAVTFYKNGTSQGVAFNTNISGRTIQISLNNGSGGATQTYSINFGQRPFAYTAPSGFQALCTQNLPTPTIGATTATQAGKYFNPVLYTGNGSTNAITGVGFAPDLVWIKSRSAAYNNRLYDQLRGVQNVLQSNSTAAEASDGTGLTAFGSDGFTLGSSVSQNENTTSFVSWNWKANGTGSSNTSGSITSTVSANTTSGFSVVTWTAPASTGTHTVGHGLGVAPSMIIAKSRSGGTGGLGWSVYFTTLGNSAGLALNTTAASFSSANYWGSSNPTSTVFSLNDAASASGYDNNTGNMVAYCFAPIAGYSAFGSYTGNGSADGPFVYCGFQPAFVMTKATSTTGGWGIYDNKRLASYNQASGAVLVANSANAEYSDTSYTPVDFLSNGFKIRNVGGEDNTSGATFIFMAFAQNPFKTSLAR